MTSPSDSDGAGGAKRCDRPYCGTMARILLIVAAVIVVAMAVLLMFHLIYVAFLIFLFGLLAFSMFRIGRFAGRGSRE
jgi:hypothetical protein